MGRPLYFAAVVSIILLLSFFFFSSPNLSGRSLDVYHTFILLHTWCGVSANLECMSEMCYLAQIAGRKIYAKSRHLHTIAQLCQAISLQLRHVSTIRKKLVKCQYLLHMSSQYGELRSTNGWDLLASLGHPSKFQRVSRLYFITAPPSLNGGQPNFARCLAEKRRKKGEETTAAKYNVRICYAGRP